VAAGEHPSPVPHAQIVTTTTHKTLRGPRAGIILSNSEWAQKIDKAVFPGMQGGPLMHVVAAKAVSFKEAMTEEFRRYQAQIRRNAAALAAALAGRGFRLVAGGTDNHLMLVDLTSKDMTGKVAQQILDDCGIVINKNTIPFDKQTPFVTSGIRIGTPAVTTRGMAEAEMETIGSLIAEALESGGDESRLAQIKKSVKELCDAFPIHGEQVS
jgi:glycine hydroxymethyltransferase